MGGVRQHSGEEMPLEVKALAKHRGRNKCAEKGDWTEAESSTTRRGDNYLKVQGCVLTSKQISPLANVSGINSVEEEIRRIASDPHNRFLAKVCVPFICLKSYANFIISILFCPGIISFFECTE